MSKEVYFMVYWCSETQKFYTSQRADFVAGNILDEYDDTWGANDELSAKVENALRGLFDLAGKVEIEGA